MTDGAYVSFLACLKGIVYLVVWNQLKPVLEAIGRRAISCGTPVFILWASLRYCFTSNHLTIVAYPLISVQ